MLYQKFQATQLFTGTQMLGSHAVLITNSLGEIEDITDTKDAGEGVQQLDGVLSPGFINCHCHLELSHMKGLIPEQTGLVDFVCKVVTERHVAEDEIVAAIARAEDKMLLNGTVAVGDICNTTLTIFQKQKARLAYYNFIETSGWLPQLAETKLQHSLQLLNAFQQSQTPNSKLQTPNSKLQTPDFRLQTSLSPHAPYSVSDNLWTLIQPHFTGKTITIHNQETPFEDELFRSGQGDFVRMYEMMKLDTGFFTPTGKSSLQSFLANLKNAEQILLVHNTFTREEDIQYAMQKNGSINWCICINANQYIEKAVPPIDAIRKHNGQIVLGTDSLASNHSLSILDELKTIHTYFPHISLSEMLGWATINGAKALQMNDALGSFEKGKTPGILLLQHLEGNNIQPDSTVTRLL